MRNDMCWKESVKQVVRLSGERWCSCTQKKGGSVPSRKEGLERNGEDRPY